MRPISESGLPRNAQGDCAGALRRGAAALDGSGVPLLDATLADVRRATRLRIRGACDGPVVVIGHQKGRDTREKVRRNFGMPRPEGYRKALRLMKLAEKFSLPVFTFVDTPGAYPGLPAEERNLAGALSQYTQVSSPSRKLSKYQDLHFFVQDTWKVSRRLTFDFGVRSSRRAAITPFPSRE